MYFGLVSVAVERKKKEESEMPRICGGICRVAHGLMNGVLQFCCCTLISESNLLVITACLHFDTAASYRDTDLEHADCMQHNLMSEHQSSPQRLSSRDGSYILGTGVLDKLVTVKVIEMRAFVAIVPMKVSMYSHLKKFLHTICSAYMQVDRTLYFVASHLPNGLVENTRILY